ncbi:amino acid adenylation domain-containing protein [Streptantibioticus rubrisoli]|uniref:Amino acid adenylation domain-containing protein n=1 Tax=Streptantibioticus rubrisoli TaxID=1387313 RepID=A0ABT1PCA7_9ACTN|nr:amino acid adenylation domain-containing protein [Streptantibioticus rubrisoli]MCQ4041863.1 amino acid adenylation domain-containing protein [Streptantibioticus rubrisoli]
MECSNLLEAVVDTAAESPDLPAVIDRDGRVEYGRLVGRAHALADELRALGVGPGDRVVLAVPPGRDAVAGALACFMSRAAYVPIDPAQPTSRIQAMAEACSPAARITSPGLLPDDSRTLNVASGDRAWRDVKPPADLRYDRPRPDDVAYVMHTSGTTGTPKGVQVEHRGLLNLLADVDRRAPVCQGHRGTWWTSPSFDVSVWETWGPLSRGGSVTVVPADDRLDASRFLEFLHTSRAHSAYVPPAFLPDLREFLRSQPGHCTLLTRLLVGVEPIPLGLLQDIARARPNLTVVNGYGPAETTICCTLFTVPRHGGSPEERTPIGTAVRGNRLYLLDGEGRLATGDTGELLVAGAGVARGYLESAGSRAHGFRPAPDGPPGTRAYRTGDLVRIRPDGNLVFLGRADRQLKVRGYRIEPGEVETALRSVTRLREAVVAQREIPGSGSAVVAYLVPERSERADTGEIRRHLRAVLPDYAIPSVIWLLSALPQTSNGKTDHAALAQLPLPAADPEPSTAEADSAVRPSRLDDVLRVWAALLPEPPTDGAAFVELGGTSLSAARAAAELRTLTGTATSAADVLSAASAHELAVRLATAEGTADARPPANGTRGRMAGPLSPSQLGLWMHDELRPGDATYLEPLCFELRGALDEDRLAHAVAAAGDAHPAFGAVVERDGRTRRLVLGRNPVRLEVRDLAPGLDDEEIPDLLVTEARKPMDLSSGPLLRCLLLRRRPDHHLLLLVWHHLVTDGWSTRLFLSDVARCYRDPAAVLDTSPTTIVDLNHERAERLRAAAHRSRLRDVSEMLADTPVHIETSSHGQQSDATVPHPAAALPFHVDRGLIGPLTAKARSLRVTPFTMVLAAYQHAFASAVGVERFILGCAVSGRSEPGSEKVAGFLVDTVLVPCRRIDGSSAKDRLRAAARAFERAATAQEGLPLPSVVHQLRQDGRRLPTVFPQLYLSLDEDYELDLGTPTATAVPVSWPRAKFDASLSLRHGAQHIEGALEYSTAFLTPQQALSLREAFTEELITLAEGRP